MNTAVLGIEIVHLLEIDGYVTGDALLSAVLVSCDSSAERKEMEEGGFAWERYGQVRRLLGFAWDCRGAPNSSSDCMNLITLGSHNYISLPAELADDMHPFLILGSAPTDVGKDGIPPLVIGCLRRLLSDRRVVDASTSQ